MSGVADLADRSCVPCKGGVPPLPRAEAERLLGELGGDWRLTNAGRLEREYRFPDFATALAFVDRVGEVAEAERHHPDVHLAWGKVRLTIWTHAIDGLTESDFILAAKADRCLREG